MRNFRKWLRWISKGRHATGQLNARLTLLGEDLRKNDISLDQRLTILEDRGPGSVEARLLLIEARHRYDDAHPMETLIEPAMDSKLAALQTDFEEQLKQIRERLEMGQKRKSSGRPFSVLRKVAEMGEAAKRDTVA